MEAPFNCGYGAHRIQGLLDYVGFNEYRLETNMGGAEPLPPHLLPFKRLYAKYRGFQVLSLEMIPYYARHPIKRFVIIFPRHISQTHAIKVCLNQAERNRLDIKLFIDFPIVSLLDGNANDPEAPYVAYRLTDMPAVLPPEYTQKNNTPQMWDCMMLMLSVFLKPDQTEYLAMKYIVTKLEEIFEKKKVPEAQMKIKYKTLTDLNY